MRQHGHQPKGEPREPPDNLPNQGTSGRRDTCRVRYWAMIRGTLTQISEAEADARYCSPANGVYDEAFDRRFRDHIACVTERFDGMRPGGRPGD